MTKEYHEVSAILASQGLVQTRVMRDGPRYWVGEVRRNGGGEPLILKIVINDEPWRSTDTQTFFRPSDQLKAEIATIKFLHSRAKLAQVRVPNYYASSETDPVWFIRQSIGGRDMAAGDSSFVFAERFYSEVTPEALIEYVLGYQQATPGLKLTLKAAPRSFQADLRAKMYLGGLHTPQPRLQPYATAVNTYLEDRRELHDTAETALIHGELYPPHLFIEDGQICTIDWENAGLDNRLHDLVAVWVRAYGSSGWQAKFRQEIRRRGAEFGPNWQELFDLEVVYQAARALNYLDWSCAETPEVQRLVEMWLRANLDEVLGRPSKV